MTSTFQLSPEQRAIVEAAETQVAVVASAGSGKTRVLVERYLRHVLQEGIAPDRLLTITFTRKAAAEMKERIVAGLRAAKAYDEAQIAETGPIQTIHALCEQLLRENAVEAGVDAQFEILSESQSSRLQLEAIEEAIASIDSEFKEAEKLIAGLAGRRLYNRANSPYARLQYAIQETLRQLRGSGRPYSEFLEIYRNAAAFRAESTCLLLDSQPEYVRSFEGVPDEEWRETLVKAWKFAKKPTPNWLRNLPDRNAELQSEEETCGVAQIALEAWILLESRMTNLQTFDFTYLEEKTLAVLRGSLTLPAALSQKFEVVMVDEAQDLNPNQYALIEILGRNRKLTVGDERQSIYGFRLADPELFKASHANGARRLSRNYRSAPGVLNFVDRVFTSVWSEGYKSMRQQEAFDFDIVSEPDYEGVELWDMPSNDYSTIGDYVKKLIDEENSPGEICVLARNGATCQAIHEELANRKIESRIHGGSEKFYTRMEVRDLSNILRALADPYDDFALLATLRSQAVGISLEGLIRLGLKRPVVDNLGEIELGETDAPKLKSFLSWFEPMRGYADRLSAWEVLSRVFVDTPFLESLGEVDSDRRQLANVRKLLTLAAQDSHLGPLEFADQIREIQELRHKEPDAEEFIEEDGAVRIMTIHKAKGLEFPIVVLPETNRKFGRSFDEIVYDPRLRILSAHFGSTPGLFHKYLSERKKDREAAEELRVLYVAMTRARKKLCVAIYPQIPGTTISRLVRGAIGEPFPSSILVRRVT